MDIADRIYDLITQDAGLSVEEAGEDNGVVLSVITDSGDHYHITIRKI